MIQSTECWHRVHIDCLKEVLIKNKKNNDPTKCPTCGQVIQDYELNEYLSKEEIADIEKAVIANMLKVSPDFV